MKREYFTEGFSFRRMLFFFGKKWLHCKHLQQIPEKEIFKGGDSLYNRKSDMHYRIQYIDRVTGKREEEKVYGDWALRLLYEKKGGALLLPFIASFSFFSKMYGFLQRRRSSRKKILPFIRKFQVPMEEYEKKAEEFLSFDDFFTRKLKRGSRKFSQDPKEAILFADGRYLFFEKVEEVYRFFVKGREFSLSSLLQDESLSGEYRDGSMVIARLAPMDYHRFHFPFEVEIKKSWEIPGPLYSVNPLALRKNWHYLCENKRVITEMENPHFGKVLYIEIGATYVGTIHQTYDPAKSGKKGEEKGYFSFGGSCIILLFQKDKILFDSDLLEGARQNMEVKALFGQPMGKAIK